MTCTMLAFLGVCLELNAQRLGSSILRRRSLSVAEPQTR